MSSTIGTRKVNKKGRATGQLKTNKRLKIGALFVPHRIDMLDSPAWRTLSLSGRRILDRIGIEHFRHGGVENGRLPVTFDDFVRYGVHRQAIAPAIRECEALGFLEVTERGRAGNAEFRTPNKFRLTYMPALGREPATHEWRKIETMEEAEMLSRNVRRSAQKTESQCGKTYQSQYGNRHRKALIS